MTGVADGLVVSQTRALVAHLCKQPSRLPKVDDLLFCIGLLGMKVLSTAVLAAYGDRRSDMKPCGVADPTKDR